MKKIYIGTCGQVMAWKKLLATYSALEINSTFYYFPSVRQRENWKKLLASRNNFFLSLKAYQGFTHPYRSPTWKKAKLSQEEFAKIKHYVGCLKWNQVTKNFWEEMLLLSKELKADFLLFQLPNSCAKEKENIAYFFEEISQDLPFRLGLEIRWPDKTLLLNLWQKFRIIPVFDPFIDTELKDLFFPLLDFIYLRLHGKMENKRLNYKYRYSDEDLQKLDQWIQEVQGQTVCVLFNNVYMKEDALRFKERLENRK